MPRFLTPPHCDALQFHNVTSSANRILRSHLAALGSAYPADFWLVGGALLGRAPHDARNEAGKPLPMQGSAALVWAESEEVVRETLAADVYAREGVWDLEKLQIWAFKSAVRKGL